MRVAILLPSLLVLSQLYLSTHRNVEWENLGLSGKIMLTPNLAVADPVAAIMHINFWNIFFRFKVVL
jgi:hypothetical protein